MSALCALTYHTMLDLSKLNRWKKLSTGSAAGAAWKGPPAREGRPPALRTVRAADSMPPSTAALSSFSARRLAALLPHDRAYDIKAARRPH